MPEQKHEYDVCLSFAGEDREYVNKIARLLAEEGVSVFYDIYEEDDLWGKDLYQHLSDLYKNRCRYAIVFVSEAYSRKLWTRHELKSAQARAFEENDEYILPIIFDETEIPGLLKTVGHLDARKKSAYQIVRTFLLKLRKEPIVPNFPEHPYYIFFENREKFDYWHEEVCRKMGYPRYGSRNGKVSYDSQGTERWTEPLPHRNNDDPRIAALVKEDRMPSDMIDQLAEHEYRFVRISRNDFQQIGFVDPIDGFEPLIPGLPFIMKKKEES